MTGIILAAGVGSRLRPLTDTLPKCLLSVGGKTILQRILESLISRQFTDVLIVTGYRSEQIRDHVLSRFGGSPIRFVDNPLYASTNNIHSLWMALRETPGGGMLLMDSDIVFDGEILDLLAGSGHVNCLAVSSQHPLGEEEVKVKTRRDGSIVAIGKEIPPALAAGESVGIEQFAEEGATALREILEKFVVREGRVGLFYEAAFQALIEGGIVMKAVDVGRLLCKEIDTYEDLAAIRSLGDVHHG
jgi:choline kinase